MIADVPRLSQDQSSRPFKARDIISSDFPPCCQYISVNPGQNSIIRQPCRKFERKRPTGVRRVEDLNCSTVQIVRWSDEIKSLASADRIAAVSDPRVAQTASISHHCKKAESSIYLHLMVPESSANVATMSSRPESQCCRSELSRFDLKHSPWDISIMVPTPVLVVLRPMPREMKILENQGKTEKLELFHSSTIYPPGGYARAKLWYSGCTVKIIDRNTN
jgi:hypothetical protein